MLILNINLVKKCTSSISNFPIFLVIKINILYFIMIILFCYLIRSTQLVVEVT